LGGFASAGFAGVAGEGAGRVSLSGRGTPNPPSVEFCAIAGAVEVTPSSIANAKVDAIVGLAMGSPISCGSSETHAQWLSAQSTHRRPAMQSIFRPRL
jgi:hypothetical protein